MARCKRCPHKEHNHMLSSAGNFASHVRPCMLCSCAGFEPEDTAPAPIYDEVEEAIVQPEAGARVAGDALLDTEPVNNLHKALAAAYEWNEARKGIPVAQPGAGGKPIIVKDLACKIAAKVEHTSWLDLSDGTREHYMIVATAVRDILKPSPVTPRTAMTSPAIQPEPAAGQVGAKPDSTEATAEILDLELMGELERARQELAELRAKTSER